MSAELPELIGRYKTGEILGVGGFGLVVRAQDEALGDTVAIKILGASHAADSALRKRFVDEARLLRTVRSDHLITIHDIGELPDGRPFFVMDLADRGTFAERLGDSSKSGVDSVSLQAVVGALAESLAALHAAGYVHRDVSPANLLLQSRGPGSLQSPGTATVVRSGLVCSEERLLLGDLGLAKDVVSRSEVTIVGGTPRYCAPEQLDPDGEVGPATDVYGATAILWRLVTGQTPPESHRLQDSLQQAPDRWHAFLSRGMAERVQHRFPDMQAWRSAALASFDSSSGNLIPHSSRYSTDECPYQGLAAFQIQDAERFYGREQLVQTMVERLRHNRVLIVGGASGSGKSSLVRAGLIPALRSGALAGSRHWPTLLFTPGANPLQELQYQLRKTLDAIHLPADSVQTQQQDTLYWRILVEKTTDVTGGLLICIDQFEELFTFDHPQQRLQQIIEVLSAVSDPANSQVRLLCVIRADFYASASRFQWLARAASDSQLLVGPMSRRELMEAITRPARLAGLHVEEALLETILEEVADNAGTLPLVSHALAETWKLRQGNRLTLDNYRAVGGMSGAIGQSAEKLYSEKFTPAQQAATRRLMLRLINPGEGVPDTRRPYPLADLRDNVEDPVQNEVMQALVEARLLTIDNDIVQLAHEAVILTWPRLHDWVAESRDDLRVLQRIERVAAEWQEAGRDPDLLYHGTPLLTAMEWFENHRDTVNELEAEFLHAGQQREQAARLHSEAVASRGRRFRRGAFIALSFLLVASTLSSLLAYQAYQQARRNELAANFRLGQSLASQAADLAERDPRLALALAVEVLERQQTAPLEARAALVDAAAALEASAYTPLSSVLVGDAITVAVHPQRDMVVTGYRNGSVGFWNTRGHSAGDAVLAHGGAIEEFAFSQDGSMLLSVGVDGTVMRWDLADAAALPSPQLVADLQHLLWSVSFAPDGRHFAVASVDGSVRLFETEDYQQHRVLADIDRDFLTVQFSSDSSRLYAGSADGEIWGWQVADGRAAFEPYIAHDSGVWEIVFYPDGSRFATASTDGRVRVWDSDSRQQLHEPFAGVASDVRGVQIDKHGLLLAGDEQGRLLFWDTHSAAYQGASAARHDAQVIDGSIQQPGSLMISFAMDQVMRSWRGYPEKSWLSLARHEQGAYALAVSGDGTLLATGDGAGYVRLFSMPSGEALSIPLALFRQRIWAAAFDASGRLLAAADKQGTLALWDVSTGRRIARREQAHAGSISSLVFHAGRGVLFSAGADGVVRQWGSDTLAPQQAQMAGHSGGVSRFSLSPDGNALVVADRTGALRIWNLDSSELLRQWQADDNTVWSVAWSADGEQIATAHADEFVRLWDAASGSALRELTPHPGGATDVAFLADGVTLVSSSRDGSLRLWDRELGLRLGEAFAHSGSPVWRLAASTTENWFASSSADGEVRVWNTLNQSIICQQAVWDSEAQRRYLGVGEAPVACVQNGAAVHADAAS